MGNETLSNTAEKLEVFPDDKEIRFGEQRATVEQIDDLKRVSEQVDDAVAVTMPVASVNVGSHNEKVFDFIKSGEEVSDATLGHVKKIITDDQDNPYKMNEDVQKMSEQLLGRKK